MNSCNNINLLLKIKKVVEIYIYNLVSENIVCQAHSHSSVANSMKGQMHQIPIFQVSKE